MKQHARLKSEGVCSSEMKALLQGQTNGKILLIFDGYDEYTKGSNEEVDEMLLNGKDNCMIIVSSRSGSFLHSIKTSMDEEVRITGLSYDNITRCAEQYLGSKRSCKDFLFQATEVRGLLHIPIILLMACTVFIENSCLPSTKTGLFKKVVHMSVSRTTLKTMGKTANEVENLHELMVKLGKLAWEALNRQSKQLIVFRVRF